MRGFSYARARSVDDVVVGAQDGDMALIAGGTEVLNWARISIERPRRVLDISGVPRLGGIEQLGDGGLRIGALAKLNQVALDTRSGPATRFSHRPSWRLRRLSCAILPP